MNTRSAVASLRRRAGILIAAAIVGLAGGIAYVLVEPAPLTSTAVVLLPTPALADSSSSDVDTQVRIALSTTVLEQAGQSVTPNMTPRQVERAIKITAPTDQLIQIDATSIDGTRAQTLAQAVADSYVGYVGNTAREVTAAALADLKQRKDALQKQIDQLQTEIDAAMTRQRGDDPRSAQAREEAQLLAGLRTQQANLSLQLDKVEDKIATGAPSSQTAGAGTSVIQPATGAVGQPAAMRLMIWSTIGALGALILTAIVLLALSRRDARLRFRDEIADAVGSPVAAAVRTRPQVSVSGWTTLFATYEATPVESWAYRQALRSLVPADRKTESRSLLRLDHPASITVISIVGDDKALAVGPQLAAFAASLGISTQVLAATEDDDRATALWAASALWAACLGKRGAVRAGLHLGENLEENDDQIDLTVILTVVDRLKPSLSRATSSVATVLAVAAGTATEEELARVAVAVDDAGRRIDGIIVADPDPSDRTSGRHTMDERARQASLPTRITGISSSRQLARDRQGGGAR